MCIRDRYRGSKEDSSNRKTGVDGAAERVGSSGDPFYTISSDRRGDSGSDETEGRDRDLTEDG